MEPILTALAIFGVLLLIILGFAILVGASFGYVLNKNQILISQVLGLGIFLALTFFLEPSISFFKVIDSFQAGSIALLIATFVYNCKKQDGVTKTILILSSISAAWYFLSGFIGTAITILPNSDKIIFGNLQNSLFLLASLNLTASAVQFMLLVEKKIRG